MTLTLPEAAQHYDRRAWPLVKYPAGSKGPRARGWQNSTVPPQQFAAGDNIGIILGARAGGLVDLDLDTPAARLIARRLLPEGWLRWSAGRAGHGRGTPGHYFVIIRDLPLDFTRRALNDQPPAGKPTNVLEMRASRHQTMMPPSVHPSGEIIEWTDESWIRDPKAMPPAVPFDDWQARAEEIWQIARIANRWGEGIRHDATAAVAGWLYHQGIELNRAREIVRAICDATGDDESGDRIRAVEDTYQRAEAGHPVKGLRALETLLGPKTIAGGRDVRSSQLRRTPKRAAGGETPEGADQPEFEQIRRDQPKTEARTGPSARSFDPPRTRTPGEGALELVAQQPGDASDVSEERLAVKVANTYLGELRRRRERMIWYRDSFWDFEGGAYEQLERGRVRADVRQAVAAGATPATLGNALSVLEDQLTVGQGRRAPQPAPFDVNSGRSLPGGPHIVFNDGVIDIAGDRELHPHNPDHFHEHRVPFNYPRSAAPAPRWNQCIEEWFGEAIGEERLLKQWFGYIISGSTSHERLVAFVGKPGSGKSTAAWALEQLVGPQRVVHATLSSVASRFGLQSWPGKTLVVFEEARSLSRRDDIGLAQSRILSITGRDPVEVEQKNRDATTEMLGCRLMFVSNKVPNIEDDTGAFHRRLMTVNFERSVEQADTTLREQLAAELPGILSWALAGLDDLRASGAFSETAASQLTRESDLATASPLRAYAEARLIFDPRLQVAGQALTDDYNRWARANSVSETTPHALARRVRDTFQLQQRRTGTARLWQGVGLREGDAFDGSDAFA